MCTQKKQVDELFPNRAFSSGQVLSKEAHLFLYLYICLSKKDLCFLSF